MKRLLHVCMLATSLLVAPCATAKTAHTATNRKNFYDVYAPQYVLRIKPLSRTEVQISAAKHSFNNACQYVYNLFAE